MHPIQMDTLARQRWDELVAHGAAARANRRYRHRTLRVGSARFALLVRRAVGRTPGREGRPRQVATLP